MQAPAPSTPKAAGWMAGWLTLMLIIAVAGREAMRELALFQLMALRSLLGLLLLWPLLHAHGGLAAVRTRRLRDHAARNVVHFGAQYAWFAALAMIPLAQVVAIEFTMPVWTILLAAAFLGERITRWKLLAVGLGLLGVVLIVRPAASGLNSGQLVALAASVGFAFATTLTKSLTRSETAVTIIFWMLVVQSLLALLPALAVWRWPSGTVWGWVGVVAFCGTFSHYCLAQAMRHADVTVVVPMDYLRVPLAALLGWWVYHERLDMLTLLGAALILCGNLLNTRRAAAPGRPARVLD